MTNDTHAPNPAKYDAAAAIPTTWARMVNHTNFGAPGGCWEWTGHRNVAGYGMITVRGAGSCVAHRLALHIVGRPVPADLTVDHLCGNTSCVNPDHLDTVEIVENVMRGSRNPYAINARKTHCSQGHPYDEQNTYWYTAKKTGNPARSCRTCRKVWANRTRQRSSGAVA